MTTPWVGNLFLTSGTGIELVKPDAVGHGGTTIKVSGGVSGAFTAGIVPVATSSGVLDDSLIQASTSIGSTGPTLTVSADTIALGHSGSVNPQTITTVSAGVDLNLDSANVIRIGGAGNNASEVQIGTFFDSPSAIILGGSIGANVVRLNVIGGSVVSPTLQLNDGTHDAAIGCVQSTAAGANIIIVSGRAGGTNGDGGGNLTLQSGDGATGGGNGGDIRLQLGTGSGGSGGNLRITTLTTTNPNIPGAVYVGAGNALLIST